MILIEKLALNISKKIALQMNYDEDRKAVIAYGLMAILQISTIFIIVSIIGVIFDFWYECVIIFLGVGIIRKSTGGAHASSMNSCTFISIFSITMLSMLSRYPLSFPVTIYINIGITVIVFALSFIVFYMRVPIDSPNKPIVKPEKIKRLRKQSFSLLVLGFIITIVFILLTLVDNRFYSIAVSMRLAMLWVILTLTKKGSFYLSKIESYITILIH